MLVDTSLDNMAFQPAMARYKVAGSRLSLSEHFWVCYIAVENS